jgi:hemerythrin
MNNIKNMIYRLVKYLKAVFAEENAYLDRYYKDDFHSSKLTI